jgi:hypothetical protein
VATGLRQAAAHHVADAQNHDVEPRPVGSEVILMRVSGTDEGRRDQYTNNRNDINDEFRCLEGNFGFVTTPSGDASVAWALIACPPESPLTSPRDTPTPLGRYIRAIGRGR